MSDKVYIGRSAIDLNSSPALYPISRVRLVASEDAEYVSGDNSGRTIEIECPWGTQAMADDLLASLGGYSYQPLDVQTAFEANPLWELGDGVTVGGLYSQIVGMPSSFGLKFTADVNAPESEEINHEYPFVSKENRAIERKLAQTRASLRIDVDAIEARVEGLDGSVSALSVAVGNISTEVSGKINGQQAQTLINQTLEDISLSVSGTDGTTTFKLKQGSATLSTTTFDLHVDALNVEGDITARYLSSDAVITNGITLSGLLHIELNGRTTYGYVGGASGLESGIGAILTSPSLNNYVVATDAATRISYNGYNNTKNIWVASGGCYSNEAMQVYSDRILKQNISYDMGKFDGVFDLLRPCEFAYKNNLERQHFGFVAQDVVAAFTQSGVDASDYSLVGYDAEKAVFSVGYSEMIALCIDQIQKLKARVNALETAS